MTPTPEQMERSRADTEDHIRKVQAALDEVLANLTARAVYHDASKLQEPELTGFAALHANLADIRYVTPEYRAALDAARPVIDHHYALNTHHPEHWPMPINDDIKALRIALLFFQSIELPPEQAQLKEQIARQLKHDIAVMESRIAGMSLLDVIEMFCDWYAAGRRTKQGSLAQSLEVNRARFGADPTLASIFENTRKEMGWE